MAEIRKYPADRGMFLSKLAGLILIGILIVGAAAVMQAVEISGDFGKESVWIAAGSAVAVIVLIGILTYFYCKSYRFWITGDAVCSQTRLIYRREIALPLAKMHTINTRRNLFEILFGCMTVMADSGSVLSSMTEQFKVTLKKSKAEELYRYLKQAAETTASGLPAPTFSFSDQAKSKADQEKLRPDFQMRPVGYFLCGAVSGIFWLITAAVIVLIFLISYVFPVGVPVWILIVSGVGGLLAYYLISVLYYTLIFYGYRVYRKGDRITITYGSFTQKDFGLPISKITMITTYQNPIMQIFKQCSVRLQMIGYGASGGEEKIPPILFLICNRRRADRLLASVLPEFSDTTQPEKVTRKSAIHFFVLKNCLIFITVIVVCIAGMLLIGSAAPIFLIAIPVSFTIRMLHSYLAYRNTAAACGENCISVRRGGLIRRDSVLLKSAVQSVSIRSGPIRKRQKIGSIKISCYRNLYAKDVVIPYFQESMFADIVRTLVYG